MMNIPFDPVYLWTIPKIQLKMMNIPFDPVYLWTIPKIKLKMMNIPFDPYNKSIYWIFPCTVYTPYTVYIDKAGEQLIIVNVE